MNLSQESGDKPRAPEAELLETTVRVGDEDIVLNMDNCDLVKVINGVDAKASLAMISVDSETILDGIGDAGADYDYVLHRTEAHNGNLTHRVVRINIHLIDPAFIKTLEKRKGFRQDEWPDERANIAYKQMLASKMHRHSDAASEDTAALNAVS